MANIKIENVCDIDESCMTAGDHITTFDLDGIKCGVAICYDINFDDYIKLYRKEGTFWEGLLAKKINTSISD